MAYALSTQDSPASEAPPKSRPMLGSATFTMNRSRLDMKIAATTTVNTARGPAPGRATFWPLPWDCPRFGIPTVMAEG